MVPELTNTPPLDWIAPNSPSIVPLFWIGTAAMIPQPPADVMVPELSSSCSIPDDYEAF